MRTVLFENLKFKVLACQMRNIFLLHIMQLFHSTVKAAGQLISQMLTRIRLRTPCQHQVKSMYLLLFVCGCVWLLMPQENQTELNKRRHSHPSQSLSIAEDDRQNADTAVFSNWIWDIIYSCFNMSGKSCANNPHSLTFVLSLSLFLWISGWVDG